MVPGVWLFFNDFHSESKVSLGQSYLKLKIIKNLDCIYGLKSRFKKNNDLLCKPKGGNIKIIKWNYFLILNPEQNIRIMLCPGNNVTL